MTKFLAKICITSLLTIIYVMPATAQQITVSDVKQMQVNVQSGSFTAMAEWNALTYYLQGVIEGIAAHNKILSSTNSGKKFCPPKGKSYSIEEVFRLLGEADSKAQKKPAAEVLFAQYVKKFPC